MEELNSRAMVLRTDEQFFRENGKLWIEIEKDGVTSEIIGSSSCYSYGLYFDEVEGITKEGYGEVKVDDKNYRMLCNPQRTKTY